MARKDKELVSRPTRLLAYAGAREWRKGGGTLHIYAAVGDDWESKPPPLVELGEAPPDTLLPFGKKLGRWTRPGQVIRVAYDSAESGSVFAGTAEVVGEYPSDTCLEWGTLHHTAEASAARSRAKKKDGQRDIVFEQLEPMRTAFRKLRTRQDRTIMLARIMDYITKGERF